MIPTDESRSTTMAYLRTHLLRSCMRTRIDLMQREKNFTPDSLERHYTRLQKITLALQEWRKDPAVKNVWQRWPRSLKGGPDDIFDLTHKAELLLQDGIETPPREDKCRKALAYLSEAQKQIDYTVLLLSFSQQELHFPTRTTPPIYSPDTQQSAEKAVSANIRLLELELDRQQHMPGPRNFDRVLSLAREAAEDYTLLLLYTNAELSRAQVSNGETLVRLLSTARMNMWGEPGVNEISELYEELMRKRQNQMYVHAALKEEFAKKDYVQMLREIAPERPDTSAVVHYTQARTVKEMS